MLIRQLDNEVIGFSMVRLIIRHGINETPHCSIHGAMNKLTCEIDSSGIWRCLSSHSRTKIIVGNSISYKENDRTCPASCFQFKI